jgi:transcriptional regulator with XRE-family HTH domain
MASRISSVRAEQGRLARAMRENGRPWRQVADEFVSRWGLTYLQAFRLAHGLSQEQAAARYNMKWYPERPLAGKNISYWEMWPSKSGKEPSLSKLGMLAEVYECSVSDLLADVGDHRRIDSLCEGSAAKSGIRSARESHKGSLDLSPAPVTRTGEFGSWQADPDFASGETALGSEPLALVLAEHAEKAGPEQLDSPPDLTALMAAVNNARLQYQDCRYSALIRDLPHLLARLDAACLSMDGEACRRAFALCADAYHVAAGLLLKLDDQGLAYLAADRSMRAAQASEDRVAVGASARIVTHTLMNGGHLHAATTTATGHAERLHRNVSSHTPDSLSVYGSLLLRGAIAAAQQDKRQTAHELISEADVAARQLGADGNFRWTAFGPTNARLHRVHVAVTLGDAGTAVDVARSIDLSAITVTERKASLLIDTARAFLQWGRHEKAYTALRSAEEVAHEEVAGRPSVHLLVRQLITTAPPSIRRAAEQFATQIGVSR